MMEVLPNVRTVLLLISVLFVQSVRSYRYYRSYSYYSYRYYRYSYSYTYRYYRTSYYYYYSYTGSSYSGSTTGIVVGSIIAGVLIAGTVLFICWLCKKRRRSQSTSGRVIQTSNVTSISPPRVVGTVNPNVVTYTTQEGNIAYAPALNPPKYETVVTNGSADSTGQSYGQPPPYPVTTGTETHGQQDDHVTHDTAKLVKD
uniref:Mantle protein 11 n=1 Tax=Pinctada fucata TaxID=50426 RepID=Q45TJ9_PINFU|nr:mantle protein 11 [Pinctada fucata]